MTPTPSCPLPLDNSETVQLGHGSGGTLMHRLLEKTILPALDNEWLRQGHDSAVVRIGSKGKRLAFTTDSYVVQPRFFPGGNIGSLAIHGTVNDLAMAGARPQFLSTGLIIEEGFPLNELEQVMASMREAADAAGVAVVTGDTKVVDKGKGDGLFINTSGIGEIVHDFEIGPSAIREGDAILLSGDIGRHGICILAEREGLAFETTIESDSAAIHEPVLALLEAGVEMHCLRDLTRGGLASALKELAESSRLSIEIGETSIPVEAQVQGACELLGLDPLYVANEGRMALVLPESEVEKALKILAGFPETEGSAKIGIVGAGRAGQVVLESGLGTNRIIDRLAGDQLPRIC